MRHGYVRVASSRCGFVFDVAFYPGEDANEAFRQTVRFLDGAGIPHRQYEKPWGGVIVLPNGEVITVG